MYKIMRTTVITLIIIQTIYIESVKASMAQMNLHLCSNNHTVAVQILGNGADYGCQCLVGPAKNPGVINGYTYTPGVGSHKLHLGATTWIEARKICNSENAHLAVINSKLEESVLVNMLQEQRKLITGTIVTDQAHIGIHDMYEFDDWVTIFGESIYSTGYSDWSTIYFGGCPDNYNTIQHCGAVTNSGGMDDVDCYFKLAFFCELPLIC